MAEAEGGKGEMEEKRKAFDYITRKRGLISRSRVFFLYFLSASYTRLARLIAMTYRIELTPSPLKQDFFRSLRLPNPLSNLLCHQRRFKARHLSARVPHPRVIHLQHTNEMASDSDADRRMPDVMRRAEVVEFLPMSRQSSTHQQPSLYTSKREKKK